MLADSGDNFYGYTVLRSRREIQRPSPKYWSPYRRICTSLIFVNDEPWVHDALPFVGRIEDILTKTTSVHKR